MIALANLAPSVNATWRKGSLRAFACGIAALAVVAGVSAEAQVNNNPNTPLGSRIRRDRAFPNEPIATFRQDLRSEANRERSRSMTGMLARCMWDRGNDKGIDLLERTDLGFTGYDQIGLTSDDVVARYPISFCLGHVARRNGSGAMVRFSAPGLRQSYLEAAYFDLYSDGPSWLQPGLFVEERNLPLSAGDPSIVAQLEFADCVVIADAQGADYFFRTAPETDAEHEALVALVPAFSSCVPQGVNLEVNPRAMRIAVGEGLWHAARHSAVLETTASAAIEIPEEGQ